jgi:hypothetical protein
MKVLTEAPVRFRNGEILPPADLNRNWLYAQDALDDIATRRWSKGLLTLPYVESCASPYTQATPAEERTYRFRCPVACAVERAFLNGNMTVAAAPAEWAITKTTGGSTPSGATVPWVTTRGGILTPASASAEPSVSSDGLVAAVTDVVDASNVDRVLLEADTEYQIRLSGTTFSMSRADLALHLAIDRFQAAGGAPNRPSFSPTLLRDSDPPDATVQLANQSALNTEAAKLATLKGMTPMLFLRHNVLPATDADLCTFTIPRISTVRGKATIVRIYLWAVMSAAAAAGAVTATLRDETGATLNTVSATVTGLTFQSADSGVISRSMMAAFSNTSSTPAQDYSIVLANGSATNCLKVYALVWVQW